MDNKKFKKEFKIFVPVTDKANSLIIIPGTKGIVVLSDTTGTFKVGVKIEDLKDAMDEANILASLYTEQRDESKPCNEIPLTDTSIEGNNFMDVGYADLED